MKSICCNKHITQQWALVALFGVRFFVLVSLAAHCSTSTNLKQRLLMLAQRSTHVPSLAPLLPPHSFLSLLSPSSHSPTLEHNSWEYCLSIDARTAGGTLFAGWGSCQVYVSVSSIGHFFLKKRRERGGKNKFTSFLLCHAINDWTSNCHRARTAINCAHQGCAGGSQSIAAVRKTSTIRDINMYICILWSMIARNKNTQTKAASLYRFLL